MAFVIVCAMYEKIHRLKTLMTLYYMIYLSMALQPLDLGCIFTFLIYTQSVELLELGIGPLRVRYLHTDIHPRVGFEPKTPVFKRAKTHHASDHATTMIGILHDKYGNS
jgi:hypothetical protein